MSLEDFAVHDVTIRHHPMHNPTCFDKNLNIFVSLKKWVSKENFCCTIFSLGIFLSKKKEEKETKMMNKETFNNWIYLESKLRQLLHMNKLE